jgi:hypothetical protein
LRKGGGGGIVGSKKLLDGVPEGPPGNEKRVQKST